jgi:Tol biopolymer transport system component
VNKKISHKVSFSPDGAWLAFASSDPGKANDLDAVRVDGTGLHRIATTTPEESGPAWGPAR